jgi:hypothetical protein
MATYYFLGGGSAPTDWDDGDNWYDAPSGGTNGTVPSSSDDAVISSPVDTASVGPPTILNMNIDSGGLVTTITIVCTNGCTVLNGGQIGDNATITGNVTCSTGGIIGYLSNPVTITGSLTFNNSGSTNNILIPNAICDSLILESTWTGFIEYISVSGITVYYYGYLGTIGSNMSFGGTSYYSNYPTLYYNAAASNDWHNSDNWWVDSGHTQQAYEVPSSGQDVVIEGSIYNTITDMYCNNATINYGLTMSTPYTLNVASTLTVSDTYYIGDSMYAGPDIICYHAIFDGNSYITGNSYLTSAGTVTFDSTSELGHSSYGGATILGFEGANANVVFNNFSEFVSGTITGNASFYDTSIFNTGTVTGNVTVYYDHPLPFIYGGTINGSLLYSGYSARTVYFYHTTSSEDWGGNFWYDATTGGGSSTYAPNPDISLDNVIIEASVGSNTGNLDATVATLTVNDIATSAVNVNISITCDYANFNDSSFLNTGGILTQSANHGGNSITFSDLSNNQGTLNLSDPSAVFEDGSSNDGTVNGDVDVYYPSEKPVGGTVTGFVTYYEYTLYFGGAMNDGDWSTVGNWYLDSANTNPYGSVPSEIMPYQNVIIQNNLTSNSSSTPYVYDLNTYGTYPYIENVNITVSNLATFSEETYLGTGATITGNALFENLATNRGGTITGTATFTLSSAETMINNGYDGTYGGIEFQYGKGVNGSSILGLV